MAYPSADREDVVDVVGPHRIADPYRWLEDDHDPRTREWLAAQARLYARARRGWAQAAEFRDLLAELTAFDHYGIPARCGDRIFVSFQAADAEHAALRVLGEAGCERTLVDPLALDPSGRTTLDAWSADSTGRLVAYQTSVDGTEESALCVLDVDSGEVADGPIDGCRYSAVAWIPGADAFYYVRRAPGHGPRVYRHEVGSAAGQDLEVFGAELDPSAELDLALGSDGRLVVVAATDLSSNEIWLVETAPGTPAARPTPATRHTPAAPRVPVGQDRQDEQDEQDSQDSQDEQDGWNVAWPGPDGRLYVLTDAAAPRGTLLVIDTAGGEPYRARTLVPEDTAAILDGFAVLANDGSAGGLLALWTVGGRSVLTLHDLESGARAGEVPLPGPGIVSELTCGPATGGQAWFSYTDALTPEGVYRYDQATRTCVPWRTAEVAAARGVTCTETSYPSTDGTIVRLLLTRPAGVTGALPTILHGYGAFGESQLADYYELGLAWAKRGGLFAVACVRGGGEKGEEWHHAGMREHKEQGIEDFIAAAEYLVGSGLALPGSLGAKGFSAGGLLAGAALVRRPDLFAAVACTSALLDMARYELTGLGGQWRDEFGTRDDPAELAWLLGYSPYHAVAEGTPYPAVLLVTFDGDTRVDPMHARKMCAALQHATASELPVLLRHEPGVGHASRSRSARLGYFSDLLGFFARHLVNGRNRAGGQ